MKTFFGAALLVATAAIAGPARAADLPAANYYSAPAPLSGFNWMGPYLGANVGYEWGNVSHNPTNPSGIAGGIEAGYNWQFGQFVTGVETDIQASAASDTFAPWQFTNPWFGTLRGRAGVAFDRALIYATGGFAFGNPKYSMTMSDTFGYTAAGSSNSNSTGWVLGGGLEYMLMPKWSLKGEYQYLHFGTNTINATEFLAGAATSFAVNTSSTSNFHTVRVGLNYHF